MIALALAASLAAAPVTIAPADQLPAEWAMGDFGTPIPWDGHTLYAYADIADGHGRFARNAIAVDGEFLIQPLTNPFGDSFYWITDGTELPDGSLLVAALEVINLPDAPNDGWAFEIVDTDMFVVNDPTSPASWTVASRFGRIEHGWWDGDQVEFSDQYPDLAFARDPYCGVTGDCRNTVVEFDTVDPRSGSAVAHTPASDGVFAPVQTADEWIGISWDFGANTATYWTTDDLSGQWERGDTIAYPDDQPTHAHGVNIIDGDVVHRYSTLRQRPTYRLHWEEA